MCLEEADFKNLNSDFMIFEHDVALISTTIVINSVLQSSFFYRYCEIVEQLYLCEVFDKQLHLFKVMQF